MSIKKLSTTLWMFLLFSLSYSGTLRVHSIKIDSSLLVQKCVGSSDLDSIFGIKNGSRVMKAAPKSAIAPDSVRAAYKADILAKLPYATTIDSFVIKNSGSDSLKTIGVSETWNYLHISDSIRPIGLVWDTSSGEASGCGTPNIGSLAYGAGRFVATGYNSFPGYGYCSYVSFDCKNWTIYSNGSGSYMDDMAYGNGVFVSISSSDDIITSTDGMVWLIRSLGITTGENISRIAFGNGVFIATPNSGDSVYVTSYGDTWAAKTALNGLWTGIAYGNGVWRAVAISSGATKAMYSTDNGNTWSSQTSTADANYLCIGYGDGVWVAISHMYPGGKQFVDTCTNGTSWGRADTILNNAYYKDIVYTGTKFFACGTDESDADSVNNIAFSYDGINWSVAATPSLKVGVTVSDLYCLAAGNGLICASSGHQSGCTKPFVYSGTPTENLDVDYAVPEHDHNRLVDSAADTAVVRVVNGRVGIGTAPSSRYLAVRQNIDIIGADSGLIESVTSGAGRALIVRAHQRIANGAGINLYPNANTTLPGVIRMFTNGKIRFNIDSTGLIDSIYSIRMRWLAAQTSDTVVTADVNGILGYRSAKGIVPDSSAKAGNVGTLDSLNTKKIRVGTTTSNTTVDSTGSINVGSASYKWTTYNFTATTLTAGTTASAIGSLSGDDAIYTIVEGNAVTPGIYGIFTMPNIKAFSRVVARVMYAGASTHIVSVRLRRDDLTYKAFNTITNSPVIDTAIGNRTVYNYGFDVDSCQNYIQGDSLYLELDHDPTGNSSHRLYIVELSVKQ